MKQVVHRLLLQSPLLHHVEYKSSFFFGLVLSCCGCQKISRVRSVPAMSSFFPSRPRGESAKPSSPTRTEEPNCSPCGVDLQRTLCATSGHLLGLRPRLCRWLRRFFFSKRCGSFDQLFRCYPSVNPPLNRARTPFIPRSLSSSF